MDIRIENREAFVVTGYAVETSLATNETDLTALWAEYEQILTKMQEGNSRLFGVMWYTENHSYFYMLGIEKTPGVELPGASTSVAIPAAAFAVTSVQKDASFREFNDVWTAFVQKVLPKNGYEPDAAHGKYFELYDGGACELWTPVLRSGAAGAMDAVAECEEKLRIAMIDGDVSALDALLSDDLAFVNHFGIKISKEDDLNAHRQGVIKIIEIEAISSDIRIIGDAAVVQTQVRVTASMNGETTQDSLAYIRVWQKCNDCWKLVAGQATLVT